MGTSKEMLERLKKIQRDLDRLRQERERRKPRKGGARKRHIFHRKKTKKYHRK